MAGLWRYQVAWWSDPRLAYQAGLEDGAALGWDTRRDDPTVKLIMDGVIRTYDRQALRDAADTRPDQPGEWAGLDNMTAQQRAHAYQALLATWGTP